MMVTSPPPPDPSERTDGDTTTWTYHDATGLEIRKTYADGSSIAKTYDAYNRLSIETLARGITKIHRYEHARGLLLGTTYSDDTTARSYQYNHLGQLTQIVDDAGTRTIGYNTYGEQETDSLVAGGVTHLITETRDNLGRNAGYTYARNGNVQQTVTTGYGSDGRITSAGFLHQGAEKQFGYSYLPGTNLLQTLTMPCNMTLTQSYEEKRDLLTGMAYRRGTTGVVGRTYTYDTLGRPLTRRTARKGTTVDDIFAYNIRSELTEATVSGAAYSYAYDNIGNRTSAQEAAEEATAYIANSLNQYTAIDDFVPTYDADGNQTLVKTSTGIWSVVYNAENRPMTFTNNESNTVIECAYDYMGRRSIKKVTTNGSVTLHQRYIYRGYLQIACCDLTRANHPCLWLITWDPTQPVATRPLAIQKSGTWYCYGWDLTKNICELFGSNGYINTTYTYSPYGEVTSSGSTTQPLQWSSEFYDDELGLAYYNYRYYNPLCGCWDTKDRVEMIKNSYDAYEQNPICRIDTLGLSAKETYKDFAKSFIEKNKEYIKNYGADMGLSETAIIAASMAIAEEYSTREGCKAIVDKVQDFNCRHGLPLSPLTDFGKANINECTARDIDLSPLEEKLGYLMAPLHCILHDKDNRRKFMVTDPGTVILSLLIMADTVKQIKPYIDKIPESDYREAERAQIATNAWREGAKNTTQKRMKPNSQANPNYYPKSGDTPEQVKYNYETIKQILGY